MHVRFQILGSSSKGNAALLRTENTCVLIDVGFSARRLEAMLAQIGLSLDAIDAVFLTHEHIDHTAGLRGLSKRSELPIFANRDTAEAAQKPLSRPLNWQLFETGSTFTFRDLNISNFAIPHDAADPVGFTFTTGDGTLFAPHRTIAWCTDLGYAPRLIQEKIRQADVLVLESNYDPELLETSPRAWSLKQRIKGRHGHLANEAALELLSSTENPRWKHVFLAHLSEECNCPKRVEHCFSSFFNERKIGLSIVNPLENLLPEYAF